MQCMCLLGSSILVARAQLCIVAWPRLASVTWQSPLLLSVCIVAAMVLGASRVQCLCCTVYIRCAVASVFSVYVVCKPVL